MSKKVAKTRGWQELQLLLQDKTQEELSTLTGVSQATISLVLNRERLPGADSMFGFAKVGIDPMWWREPPRTESSGSLKAVTSKATGTEDP